MKCGVQIIRQTTLIFNLIGRRFFLGVGRGENNRQNKSTNRNYINFKSAFFIIYMPMCRIAFLVTMFN